jgi:hypothetical protein
VRSLLCVAVLLVSSSVAAEEAPPEVMQVAKAYLDALTGAGNDGARDLLLGGVTMNAQLFVLENWKILDKEPLRKEDGDLAGAVRSMNELDKAARQALTKVINSGGGGGDDLQMTELSQEDAVKLMKPTQEKALKFQKGFPVLSYVMRVGKEVYWHPKNPMRGVLAKAGSSGRYQVEVHRFLIETREGPRQVPRKWPLRVLRFKTGKMDTGWKILPASDWNAD